jgi:hypothetical protein
MSINMDDEKEIPPDTEACCESVASQEEVYLETCVEEIRADLSCEPEAAEEFRRRLEKLEVDWEVDTLDERCQ